MDWLKNLAVILGVAGTIVLGYLFLTHASPAVLEGSSPVSGPAPAVGDGRATAVRPDGSDEARSPASAGPAGGLAGPGAPPPADRVILERFVALTSGRNPALIPRPELQRAINSAVGSITPEVARSLAGDFQRSDDPGLRWALSFLFQSAGSDAFVDVLRDYFAQDAQRAVAALHAINSPAAHRALAALGEATDDPRHRAAIEMALARSAAPDAERRLRQSWEDPAASAEVRLSAVLALAFRDTDQARRDALEIALGPERPVEGSRGELAVSFPSGDLREPAVHALLRTGDLAALQRLLAEGDAADSDGRLAALIDEHLVAFESRGPAVPELLIARARRKGRLSAGVARYLGRVMGASEVPALQALRPLAQDPNARQALDEALTAAALREGR